MKKWMQAAAFGLAFAAQTMFFAYGAEGRWISDNDLWMYQRPDGSMAKGSWEDINGEWYHFTADGIMQTGWQKVGNQMYCFEESGALAEGWRSLTDSDGVKWYFFDENGNAALQWKKIEGKWYWFLPSGILNMEESRNIDGRRYYFREDGSLKTNEYLKFKYLNYDGLSDSEYNIKAESAKGKKVKADESDQEEIADKINLLPEGWRKTFIDEDWHFVYCPEKEYYAAVKYEDDDDRYEVKFKVNTSKQTLYFAEPEAVWPAFGEFIYRNVKKELRAENYAATVDDLLNEIIDLEKIPDSYYKNYQKIFGVLFAGYMDPESRETMKESMPELVHIVEKIISSRRADGTVISEDNK